MTGAEVKAQVMEALSSIHRFRHLARALAPCVVLTAEEAAMVRRSVLEPHPSQREYAWAKNARDARALLALLGGDDG